MSKVDDIKENFHDEEEEIIGKINEANREKEKLERSLKSVQSQLDDFNYQWYELCHQRTLDEYVGHFIVIKHFNSDNEVNEEAYGYLEDFCACDQCDVDMHGIFFYTIKNSNTFNFFQTIFCYTMTEWNEDKNNEIEIISEEEFFDAYDKHIEHNKLHIKAVIAKIETKKSKNNGTEEQV